MLGLVLLVTIILVFLLVSLMSGEVDGGAVVAFYIIFLMVVTMWGVESNSKGGKK